jgi:hypothetical protein
MFEELRQVHRAIAEVARRIAKQQQVVAKLLQLGREYASGLPRLP